MYLINLFFLKETVYVNKVTKIVNIYNTALTIINELENLNIFKSMSKIELPISLIRGKKAYERQVIIK